MRAVSYKRNAEIEKRENAALNAVYSVLGTMTKNKGYGEVVKTRFRPIRNKVCGRVRKLVNERVIEKRKTTTVKEIPLDCVLCEVGGICTTSLKRWHATFVDLNQTNVRE